MDTRLILSDVRTVLSPMVDPTNPNNPLFLEMLNEVCERYTNSGKWKGNVVTVKFEASSGFVTLPWTYASALAMTYDRYPYPIFTEYHQYVEEGPGKVDEALHWPGILIDMGDGFCTQADITNPSTIRVYSSAADDDLKIRIYGELNGVTVYDSSGNEGEELTLAAPMVETTNQFTKITGFIKPHTKARVYLKGWDGTTETLLATYQPNETRPSYRRYQTGTTEKEIRMICQRRFIPIVAETDWVSPGNLSALRAGIQSRLFEDATDPDAADASFTRGLNFLNDEAKAYRGGGRATLDITNPTWYWGGTMNAT